MSNIRMPSPYRSSFAKGAHDGFGPGTLARAVQWIALNDESTCHDVEEMAEMISVMLVADLYDKDPIDVARAVVGHRGWRRKR